MESLCTGEGNWRRRRSLFAFLAAVVVCGAAVGLLRPAGTKTREYPTLTAEETLAWEETELGVRVEAKAEAGSPEKIIVLTSEGEGADLSSSYVFDEEGICVITDEAGREIELHRAVREEKKNTVDYWFMLASGDETAFTLELMDEVDESRFAKTVEAVKQTADEEKAETAAQDEKQTASDAAKAPAAAAPGATPSSAAKASASNADVAEANALAADNEEKIQTETHDDGFVELQDGAVITDIFLEEEDRGRVETKASLKISAGIGDDYEGAVRDAEKNADKRGDAQVKLTWQQMIIEKAVTRKLVQEENGATIAVIAHEGVLPENAELSVTEYLPGSEKYEQRLAETKELMEKPAEGGVQKEVATARFFDVTILDENGEEFEPAEGEEVQVIITYEGVTAEEEDTDLNVVHFKKQDAPEVFTMDDMESADDVLSLKLSSFSDLAMITLRAAAPPAKAGNASNLKLNWDFKWQNGGGSTGGNYEYTDEERTDLLFHPSDWTRQSANLLVSLNVIGSQDDYIDEGTVRFELPASVFEGFDGRKADAVSTQLPRKPETNSSSSFNWDYDETGEKIIVTNHSAITGGTMFEAEFSYTVFPLDVDGGYPDEEAARDAGFVDPVYGVGAVVGERDIDRTCWTKRYWKDYYTKDITCHVLIDTDKDGEGEIDNDKTLSVGMMTRAGGQVYARAMNDTKSGVYTSWQRTWGTNPDQPGEYFYVVWNLNYGRLANFAGNQPWKISAAYDSDYTAITIGGVEFKGTYVGMIRTSITGSQPYYNKDAYTYYTINGIAYSNIGIYNSRNWTSAVSKYNGASASGYKQSEDEIKGPGITAYNCGIHYAVLVKYPLQEIIAKCNEKDEEGNPLVDLANAGLPIYSRFNVTEYWDAKTVESGETKNYEITRSAVGGPARLFVREGGPGGKFGKSRVIASSEGAQSILMNGTDVDLIHLKFDGSVRYPYYVTYTGTSKTQEDSILGQKVVIEEEKLMLSPGAGVKYVEGWQPRGNANEYPLGTGYDGDGNEFLEEADYDIPRFNVRVFNEYNASRVSGAWDVDAVAANDYANYKPVYVYVRYRGEDTYQPYAFVKKDASANDTNRRANAYTRVYKWDGTFDEAADGSRIPHQGTEIAPDSQAHFPLPKNVVQIRFEHESLYYKTEFSLGINVIIHPTEHVKNTIDKDLNYVNASGVAAPRSTIVKNIARCKSWDYQAEEEGYEGKDPFYEATNVGKDTAGNVCIYLTRITNSLAVTKDATTPPNPAEGDTTSPQAIARAKGKEISYVRLVAKNEATVSKDSSGSTNAEDPYVLLSGRFYELLPRGVKVQEGSIFGVYNNTWSSHQHTSSDYQALARYKEQGIVSYDGTRYFLKKADYSYTTQLIPELGQEMLIIDFSFARPAVGACPDNYWHSYMEFFLVLENSFENIRARGLSTPNYVGFENLTKYKDQDGNEKPGISRPVAASRITALPENVRTAFKDIADRNVNSGFGRVNVPWNRVSVLQSGFDKTVATRETLDGHPQDENYISDLKDTTGEHGEKIERRITVGNHYTYRLQYTTTANTKSDNIVIYDILETGTHEERSYWKGKLDDTLTAGPIDISSIENMPSDGAAAGVTCAPVVYYSYTLTDPVEPSDPDVPNEYIDLEDASIWTTEKPDDYSKVTAIAIDCRKASDGNDFHLGNKATLAAFISMIAPTELPEDPDALAVNGALVRARDYDAIPGDLMPVPEELMSRAAVQLRDIDVSLKKDSDPMTGTIDNRTIVEALGDGKITYRLRVRSTMPFDCNNVVVEDPLPEGLTIDKVTVKLNGAAKEADAANLTGFTYELKNDRVCKFTIAKQYPTVLKKDEDTGDILIDEDTGEEVLEKDKDTYIYIYTTVDTLAGDGRKPQVPVRDYDNTATLVEANSKPVGTDTDTMYHRAETVRVPVEKAWDDEEDRYAKRPGSLEIVLTGEATPTDADTITETLDLSAGNDWEGAFVNLPKYYVNAEGTSYTVPTAWAEYTYTAAETIDAQSDLAQYYIDPVIEEIEPEEEGDVTGFKFTNRINLTRFQILKKWVENDAEVENPLDPDLKSIKVEIWRKSENTQPELVTFGQDGGVRQLVLTKNEQDPDAPWFWDASTTPELNNLPKYVHLGNGTWEEYEYYVKEIEPGDWIVNYTSTMSNADKVDANAYASAYVKANGQITVTNSKYFNPLPETGGPGTRRYLLSGLAMILGALLLYGFKRNFDGRDE